jgi:hypothetical protein
MLLFLLLLQTNIYGQGNNDDLALHSKKLLQKPFDNNIIWKGSALHIKVSTVAAYAAPILWFSPDEPSLGNYLKNGISIPEAFPFEKPAERPVVYYKILNVVTNDKKASSIAFINNQDKGASEINLEETTVFYLDYYFYYSSEVGVGSHPHDIESVVMKILVNHDDSLQQYILRVEEIIGRAHGLYWYNNIHIIISVALL